MTTADPSGRPVRVPHRLATLVTTLGLPLAVATTGAVLALSWRDTLPDPIATHWGTDGADGVGSLTATVGLVVGVVLPFSAGMAALGLWWGRAALTRRLAGAAAVWFAVVQTGVLLGSLAGQRGLTDAYAAPDIGGAIGLAVAIATVAAVAVAWLTPGDPTLLATTPIPASAPRLPVAANERATWVRRTGQVHAATILASVAVFALTFGALTQMWWLVLGVVAVLTVILFGALRWTVTVDSRGLTVRSALGPRVRVPLAEVEGATTTQVAPLRQFGGWGLRVGAHGATGIVTRKGEALEVARSGSRRVVVTVDDAATAAALLNALAERSRSTRT
ncbi:DUF1648 domain-containing protein [Actinotalea sp.]|uniref:DUF1648 domain-containing protein n=1 Tax=Actinotalea sp. TaxID=1872145 RepID=UPI003563F563